MSRKIAITTKNQKIWMFEMDDGEIVDIHISSADESPFRPALGDIYIGKVKTLVPNIEAAFIEIARGVECYYRTSQVAYAVFTKKSGGKPLCKGDELLVQVSKEAVKTKAPTVTSNLSFPGRYAILTSGNTRMGVSQKLPREQRKEWKEYLGQMKNDAYGIIIRTNAKCTGVSEVCAEIKKLKGDCDAVLEQAPFRKCFSCLRKAPLQCFTDLKSVYMEGLKEIVVEGEELYARIHSYFEKELPEDIDKLRLYDDKRISLCTLYHLHAAVTEALGKKVWMKNGAYLVISDTEALTVIDVNSGKFDIKKDPESTYLKIDKEAAKEAARQIRLRNLSGIVIVDFINLASARSRGELFKTFKEYLEKDPIPTTLVDMTALQLIEVTRKKVRKPLREWFGDFKDL